MKIKFLMKTSLMGLCLLASLEASAKDYYLAPGGTGNGMTIDKPFGDPIKAFAALKAGVWNLRSNRLRSCSLMFIVLEVVP